ncbi:MAG TPA: GTPase ObgE, partial [Sphingomicrobium sp.]|nr:GTPase ObgE [Sphingomicrobium sp.]
TDLLDDKRRAKVVKALEKASGAKVFAISAPLGEGMEPLLDIVIERLGSPESEAADSDDEPAGSSWSPL